MHDELKIAVLQSDLVWENPKKNRSNFSLMIDQVSSTVDLIILPEMFTTGFTMSPQNLPKEEGLITLGWMLETAKENKAAMVGSIPFFEDGIYTNRLFFVFPDGGYEYYDKRHTFTLAGESAVYEAGTEKLIVNFRGFRICPLVCYDLRFPVWARNTNDYDVLLYVANWPKPRIAAWDTLLKARAIENMSYCIGVNRIGADELGHIYPGHSALFDGLGERLAFAAEKEIIYAVLKKEHIVSIREKFKFLDDGDTFNFLT